MIANFFSKTKPVNYLASVLLFSVLYWTYMITTDEVLNSLEILVDTLFIWGVFLVFFYAIHSQVKRANIAGKDGYALIIGVLLCCISSNMFEYLPLISSQVLVVLSQRKLYAVKNHKAVNQKLFEASFLIGIASVLFNWNIVFLLLVYVGVIVFNRVNVRTLFIPLVGVLLPLLLLYVYYFFIDNTLLFWDSLAFQFDFSFQGFREENIIFIVSSVLVLTLLAIAATRMRLFSLSNDIKQEWPILVMHFYVGLIAVLFTADKDGSEILLIVYPVCVIIANFFQVVKQTILKELIVYGLLLIAVLSLFVF